MTYTIENIRELRRRYGLGLALIKKVCKYYDSWDDVFKVLADLSGSLVIMDGPDIFDAYLENHPEMKREI